MTSKQLLKLAMQLPDVTMKDHFGGDAISANKRMFLTIWHDHGKANIRVSLADQRALLESDEEAFGEIDNAWGRQGWTSIRIQYITPEAAQNALKRSYDYSAQKNIKPKTSVKKTASKVKRKAKSKK